MPGLESHVMRGAGSPNSFLEPPFTMQGGSVYNEMVHGALAMTNEGRNEPGLGLVTALRERTRHSAKSQGARR